MANAPIAPAPVKTVMANDQTCQPEEDGYLSLPGFDFLEQVKGHPADSQSKDRHAQQTEELSKQNQIISVTIVGICFSFSE